VPTKTNWHVFAFGSEPVINFLNIMNAMEAMLSAASWGQPGPASREFSRAFTEAFTCKALALAHTVLHSQGESLFATCGIAPTARTAEDLPDRASIVWKYD
jgi:hypothetical protein